MDKRIVCMASFPPRREGMLSVVKAILPQCDQLHLYLNGYTERPAELPDDPKLDIILAGPGMPHADLGSHGKFYWCGDEDGYYITVDDDINYPADYVDALVTAVDRYGRKAVVGYHGAIYRCGAGGRLPAVGMAKDHRTLYPYDKEVPRDMTVHMLGAGVMASYPKQIGLTSAVCTGGLHSGDDEDIAVWAQQHKVPLVRLRGRTGWVTPNNKQWIIDPLHRRTNYMRASDQKVKQWTRWTIAPLPHTNQPTVPAYHKSGPSFGDIDLSAEDLQFTNRILSSDALAAQLVTRIKQRTPTSVIRMSDGERAIIDFALTGRRTSFLSDPTYLKRIGLVGVDLKQVGQRLLWAGKEADYLACTISGLFWDCFRVHPYFAERTQYIDQFFPELMMATGRVGPLLRVGPVLVLHREHETVVPKLREKYQHPDITGMRLDSWRDQANLLKAVPHHPAQLVLCSGGASGKPWMVELARQSGKVVLDMGASLTRTWIDRPLQEP